MSSRPSSRSSTSSPDRAGALAVVPAAGQSLRMGRPKASLPYRGATVIESLLAALAAGGVEESCVVLAPLSPLEDLVKGLPGVRTAVNPEPDRGMLSSILAGLAALGGAARFEREARPLVVCPVDHPAIEPASVTALLAAAAHGASIAVPSHAGRRGHPIVIAPGLVGAVETLDPEVGLRQLLERERAAVIEVPVDDPGTVLDLDTPADYRRLLS